LIPRGIYTVLLRTVEHGYELIDGHRRLEPAPEEGDEDGNTEAGPETEAGAEAE
jgi:hypothetical protein